ncbi:MAG: ferrous iron transporter B [Candidatus Riflebacteria bacterium]|nr:ferrous iron transporter B [Candidatus Riflebacteria bacterium]
MPSIGRPTVALLGQPNCGKTTLFNALTGFRNRTVNYPGATVEWAIGPLRASLGLDADLVDLPGLTSLVPRSPDEAVTVRSLFGQADHERPAAVVVVVDSSQLSRHLYVARQALDAGLPVVVAATMGDLLARRGLALSVADLQRRLGCPVDAIDARTGDGIDGLVRLIRGVLEAPPPNAPRPVAAVLADGVLASYREIESMERDCLTPVPLPGLHLGGAAPDVDVFTARIDRWLLHPVCGLFIFGLVMVGLFASVFLLARPLMDLIDGLFAASAAWIVALSPDSLLVRLLGDGIVRGVGAVLVFLPQIVVLFLGIGFLEDSGYLARAAVLVDRPLAAIGLNGRSFVPLLSGFACAIPGMLAARTVSDRRERLLTIFVMPLMSCSARLPVYALLLAFLTPNDRPWIGGLALAALYLCSVASGAIVAGLVSRLLPRTGPSRFMLELPVYRAPRLGSILTATVDRSRHYLVKAGVPIVVISAALWLLCNLPVASTAGLSPGESRARQLEASYAGRAGKCIEPLMEPLGLDWRVGGSMVAAFAAREAFVGALAVILTVSSGDPGSRESLLLSMRAATRADGTPLFTTAATVGLVVFFVFALQCLSTLAVSAREAGSWLMPLVQLVSFTGFAYAAAFLVVTGLRAAGVD